MKRLSRWKRNGIRLAKGLPAFGVAAGDQGLPRFQSGAKIPILI